MVGILDKIAIDRKVRFLWLSGGEPLMRRDIIEFCREITQRGLVPSVSTNGTLLTAEKATAFYEVGVRYMHLSLDGADAVTHDHLRNAPGAFDRTLQGMDHLHRAKIETGASCMVTWDNIRDIPKIIELGRQYHLSILSFYLIAPIGRGEHAVYERELELMERAESTLAPYMAQNAPRIELFRTITSKKIASQETGLMKCNGNYFYTISNDGNLYACPWLAKGIHSVPPVSLLKTSFTEAREIVGTNMETYIKNRIHSLDAYCSACSHRAACQRGCPAVSNAENIDPLCWFLKNSND